MKIVAAGMAGWMYCAGACGATVVRSVGCAPTAEAAVARWLAHTPIDGPPEGYRVVAVHTDLVQRTKWILLQNCALPAAPTVSFRVPWESTPQRMLVDVHIGQPVRVVHTGDKSSIETAGWAEQQGAAGEEIRVRLSRLSSEESEAAPVIRCRVLAEGLVEVLP